jgi:hemin uptake protein HemP
MTDSRRTASFNAAPEPSVERDDLHATGQRRGAAVPAAPRRLHSEDLFGEAVEVLIEHQSQIYRLRRTALGKLILTK